MRAAATWIGRAAGAVTTLALAAAIVLGLFGLGFSGGVGDNYSTLEEPDALRVFSVVVTDFDNGRITLESGEGNELTREGRWGLEYPGGYGQLGDIVSRDEVSVTREFSPSEGEDPVPGTVARLDPSVWRGDPSSAGATFREVSYETELGEYPSWLMGSPADTWLIVVHDKGAGLESGLRLVAPAADAGMATMIIRYRNDRGAPGGPSETYQWGRSEWRDLEGAVAYATDNGADRVVVAGYGMGASVVLAFLEESNIADRVVGAILDSPVIDLASTVAFDLSQDTLGGAFDMPSAINESARLIAGWRFDIDWGEVDYSDVMPSIPVLLFHGEDDLVTPLSVSQAFAAQTPESVRLIVVPEAGFTEAWNVDPAGYESAVTSFLAGL
jgi:pimeloyl-ACP methyl ester carboxylesterase